ncbi:MAG: hypothetical protein V3U87_15380 [Methylococcaceae bacterium]
MIELFKIIRTYVPADLTTATKWPMSEKLIVEMCPSLSDIICLLRKRDPVGRVGKYIGVYEIGFGLEGFVPVRFSHPTLGQGNQSEETPSISFTTYVSDQVSDDHIGEFIEILASYHPWEHPVIEITPIQLWMPNDI